MPGGPCAQPRPTARRATEPVPATRDGPAVIRENATLSRVEAAVYEQNHFEIFHPWEQRRLIRDLAVYAPSIRVLDVAAGTGNVISKLHAEQRVALDLSLEMLLQLQAQDRAVPVVAGLAEALPFADGAFDLIVMYSAVHHLADLSPLAELWRVTRPGGVVLLDHEEAFQEHGWKRSVYASVLAALRALAAVWYWRQPEASAFARYRHTYWPCSDDFSVDFFLTDGGDPDPAVVERELRSLGMTVRRRHYLLVPLPMTSRWQQFADWLCRRMRMGHFAIEARR
jgi:ubiquinone/menaquinone biosynthesis C-methylase UbiE